MHQEIKQTKLSSLVCIVVSVWQPVQRISYWAMNWTHLEEGFI